MDIGILYKETKNIKQCNQVSGLSEMQPWFLIMREKVFLMDPMFAGMGIYPGFPGTMNSELSPLGQYVGKARKFI